jgi:hypothetical protein
MVSPSCTTLNATWLFWRLGGREWADRTKRLASQVPDLDFLSLGLVERISGGWQITANVRAR